VGLDLSSAQLAHARTLAAREGVTLRLIEASAEAVPLADASFDVVFCDHGAMTFADPYRAVPEAARLLRPGGLLAFNMASPLFDLCAPIGTGPAAPTLLHDYFGLHAIDDGDAVCFQLPYGEWIRLFRRSGLLVEDLIELRPPPGATSTYRDDLDLAWSRRWPAENIWKLRRAVGP
jgi:SAM-dependent methyltransferase